MFAVDLEARDRVPWPLKYGTPVLTIFVALVVGSLMLISLGVNPLNAYRVMFVETLTTEFGLTATLAKSIPLILAGLAVYIPMKSQLWNIGAEGQIYVGGIVGTWIGLNVDAGIFLIPLMIAGAGIVGGIWGLIPGYLKAKHDVNEIIVTLLMVFIAQKIAGYLVRGPMQGSTNFPVTAILPPSARFAEIYGNLHTGFLFVVVATALVWFMVKQSVFGYEITVLGSNPHAGYQSGMRKFWTYVLVLTIGGVLAGLAGAIEIMGVQERLSVSFSPGYGFTGIPIALLGRNGAWQVFLAGLFFGLLYVGGASMEVAFGIPAALVDVIQALIILFLITAEFFKQYKVSFGFDGTSPIGRVSKEEI